LYSCFIRSWPHAKAAVDATLLSQGTTGMWRPGHTKDPGLSYCIDMDGIYALTRSARLVDPDSPYRWDDVKAACQRYLQTAVAQLSDRASVLGTGPGKWGNNSHLMHGALYGVAECLIWWPELVKTDRPWRRASGAESARSCAYA